MRFGALVEVLLGELGVSGASGVLFEVLVTLGRDYRRVVEGMQFGVVVQVLFFGLLFEVLLTARARIFPDS